MLLATSDLVREGRSFEGFPLLLGDDLEPLEPAQRFLWDVLVENGSVTSRLTWEHYGRWLYDFFAFLHHNDLRWNQEKVPHAGHVLSRYRQWSLNELSLTPRTVNLRVGLISRFYRWAYTHGHLDHNPIRTRTVHGARNEAFLAHLGAKECEVEALKLKEFKVPPKFLTMEQIHVCRDALTHPSHALLFELMLQAGLRSCEARSFPLAYVYDPRQRKDLASVAGGHFLPVTLSAKDLDIKYGKARVIDVPWRLMEDLHAYVIHHRSGLLRSGVNASQPALLVNANGVAYTKDAVVEVFKALEKRVGFHVRPHMLRHSYATHVLRMLRRSKEFQGEPLLYVRDRLGHSDVQTTAIYLHLLNQLEGQLALAHEDYVDELFARALPRNPEI